MSLRMLRRYFADMVGGLVSILFGIPLVGPALKWLYTRVVWESAILPESFRRWLIPNPYLNEDPGFALTNYSAERLAAPNLPFTEVFNWSRQLAEGRPPKIRVSVAEDVFTLGSSGSIGDKIRDEAFKDWRSAGHGRFSRDTIRVSGVQFDPENNEYVFNVQKATYYDQGHSNLVLDYRSSVYGRKRSLREILSADRPGRLPDLDDPRLANTLGAAALLTYPRDGLQLPLMVPRTHDVSVYRGGWHCTVSTATGWPRELHPAPDLKTFVTDRLIEQLHREIGIEREHIVWLEPIAFCRELMRGGKPQMFFLGEIKLDWDGIKFCINKARTERSDLLEPIEVHNMPLFRKPHEFGSNSELLRDYQRKKYTSECAANLYYYFEWRAALEAIRAAAPASG